MPPTYAILTGKRRNLSVVLLCISDRLLKIDISYAVGIQVLK
jgi:hypothetical protein